MTVQISELPELSELSELTEVDKIRQLFDYGPYPRTPLEDSPKENYQTLYQHNLVTPYYLRHRKVVNLDGKVILDVGCGTGYSSLTLAEANPGTQIVGIDLSEESIKLARQRLKHHGFENAEFHVLAIEELPKLGIEFDYINCDEMLYLLKDPAAGLQVMKSVLKPDGLIRANLHNAYQRAAFYRAQTLFKFMGLMDESPKDFEHDVVLETLNALKETVRLRHQTWTEDYGTLEPSEQKQLLSMNFLFVGDTGFTIPDLFTMLDGAELEFVSMVNWRQWDVIDLFKDAENLPAFWGMSLAGASIPEKLHLFELLHPVHRLIDFWCAHPGESGVAVEDWSEADWQGATVHLHPQLQTDRLKDELIRCIRTGEAFAISQDVPLPTLAPVLLDPGRAACLLPLWSGAQSVRNLVERYHKLHACNPETLEPVTEAQAFEAVKDLFDRLDAFLYVLLER